jgi:hypothetical protein
MFEYDKVKGASTYRLQVQEDTIGTSFSHPVADQIDSATATLVSGLKFGKKYKWRYAGLIAGRKPQWIGPYFFSTEWGIIQKSGFLDVQVTNHNAGQASGLIICDGTHGAMDRAGKEVWYLPKLKGPYPISGQTDDSAGRQEIKHLVMDLRLTPYGTITCLYDSSIVECDLDGNILWTKQSSHLPSEIGEDNYNHCFARLPNGHYMVLGNQGWRRLPANLDTTGHRREMEIKNISGRNFVRVQIGTVLEYDKTGNVVWSWNSENYLNNYRSPDSLRIVDLEPHINAFSMDPSGKYVYVGFRNLSQIIKVEKSTGRVVDSWGPGDDHHDPQPLHLMENRRQHDANILNDSSILIFNNNTLEESRINRPNLIRYSQQSGHSGEILWQFDLGADTVNRKKTRVGGNVSLLPNGNILACTGSMNTIFEVTQEKKIVWQAEIKTNPASTENRFPFRLYRAYPVSSLYPCYFTFHTDRDSLTKVSPTCNIRLFNKGSESDSYDIVVSSAAGVIENFSTPVMTAGESSTIPIHILKEPINGQEIEIRISSQINPAIVRTSKVWYAE